MNSHFDIDLAVMAKAGAADVFGGRVFGPPASPSKVGKISGELILYFTKLLAKQELSEQFEVLSRPAP